jgi:hypothetical protein
MYAMNEAPARRRGLPQPVGVAAARQQPWGATQVSSAGGGVLGGASSSTGQEGFSLRNPQYVGVYRSRRTEQGWRAQFSYANKVSIWMVGPIQHTACAGCNIRFLTCRAPSKSCTLSAAEHRTL